MAFFKRYKVSKEITSIKRSLIHITDTPNSTFPFLKALIKELQPEVIIHTGDLVDNYKLERSARNLMFYVRDVKKLGEIFKVGNPKTIIATLGNHDDLDSVKSMIPGSRVYDGKCVEVISNYSFACAHYFQDIEDEAVDFKLYGHSPEYPSEGNRFNGLEHIHIFDLDTGNIFKVKYPRGTDSERMRLFKGGL